MLIKRRVAKSKWAKNRKKDAKRGGRGSERTTHSVALYFGLHPDKIPPGGRTGSDRWTHGD